MKTGLKMSVLAATKPQKKKITISVTNALPLVLTDIGFFWKDRKIEMSMKQIVSIYLHHQLWTTFS
jgi:hypothetical protein